MNKFMPTIAFQDFANIPVELRKPTFVNTCQNEKTYRVADQTGRILFDLLKGVYPFRSVEEITQSQEGDCFNATTALFISVAQTIGITSCEMVTGTFRNPIAKQVIFHCWLEWQGIVFNCANIPLRPFYALETEYYKRHNHLSSVIQRINYKHLEDFMTKRMEEDGSVSFEVRDAVDVLLAKTLRKQKDYFSAQSSRL